MTTPATRFVAFNLVISCNVATPPDAMTGILTASLTAAVSAKSNDFDETGNEINTDYVKMMQIVKDAGYTGYVGIEYEGQDLSEMDGIRATQKLLQKVGQELS